MIQIWRACARIDPSISEVDRLKPPRSALTCPATALLQVRYSHSPALNEKLTGQVLPVEKHHFQHPVS